MTSTNDTEPVVIDHPENFFIYNYIWGNVSCSDFANPDIAGLGVVFSFIISALAATVASISIAVLDSKIDSEDPSAFLPRRVKNWLSRGITGHAKARYRFWRTVLEELILTLADQQLVTGIALLISIYINIPMNEFSFPGGANFQDAYFTLVVYLSCLSSCTHIACIIMLRKYINSRKVITYVRLVLIIIFASLLSAAISVSEHAFSPLYRPMYIILIENAGMSRCAYDISMATITAVVLMYIFWISIVNLIIPLRVWTSGFVSRKCSFIMRMFPSNRICGTRYERILKAVCSFCLFSTPLTIFILQIVFAVVSLVFAMAQKFAVAPKPSEGDLQMGITSWCDLNNAADNQWSFGQSTAVLLLLIPILHAIQTYFDKANAPEAAEWRRKHLSRGTTLGATEDEEEGIGLEQMGVLNDQAATGVDTASQVFIRHNTW
ncbi:hypothetical protein GP486_007309 [Trichoglossum hirsutum]|uniref:Uncharacterized protein n=1 Tax=Trichoglossum hirsutum TaxID=265104 RepID=A0A9P8I6K9_9PEZI|nr:hypothetical protein GP486_007309 [Trichoglossum hirsutum]